MLENTVVITNERGSVVCVLFEWENVDAVDKLCVQYPQHEKQIRRKVAELKEAKA